MARVDGDGVESELECWCALASKCWSVEILLTDTLREFVRKEEPAEDGAEEDGVQREFDGIEFDCETADDDEAAMATAAAG